MAEAGSVILVPYGDDPLAGLADQIVARHRDTLPDLSRVLVLVPDRQAIPRLRRLLLDRAADQGVTALLGPTVETLRAWVEAHQPPERPGIGPLARELMLVEALIQHPELFNDGNPWALAESLLKLFDELTLYHVPLPAQLEPFLQRLNEAYRLPHGDIQALGREARLVHTLWQAWHRQLKEEGVLDADAAYLSQLACSLEQFPADHIAYVAGYVRLLPAEQAWLSGLLERRQATVVLHGQARDRGYHPDTALYDLAAGLGSASITPSADDDLTRVIDAAYDHESTALADRATGFVAQYPRSPLQDQVRLLKSDTAELEARAVDVQIRQWLLEGRRNIGVVTDDRRLARRLRALLERAGVVLHDHAGWALSTTSAASALENWLQALEEDFAHLPLLDLLKTPFVTSDERRETHLEAVYRLEQDVIRHENIARGLQRYRQHLAFRRERLPQGMAESTDEVATLLDFLERAAEPMLPLAGDATRRPPQGFLDALVESLQRLGMYASFENDDAGRRILQELQSMRTALARTTLQMNWLEFRGWLGRTLERFNFNPPGDGQSSVQLLGIDQTVLQRFDALVLCGLNRENLPGVSDSSPFFNSGVRTELGLPSVKQRQVERFYHFRRLLQAAPDVLLTWHAGEDGEALPCPWVEALQAFHQLAYGNDLEDATLARLAAHPGAEVLRCDSRALPAPQQPPAPVIAPLLLPESLSASSHQTLIDCPYQFFANVCLKLRPPDAIREALAKSDYGERVHRCLEAFHGGHRGLPGPFRKPLGADTRAEAIRFLEAIAEAEFAADLEDNFMHRGWLKRWLQLIPSYIDWQIKREQLWRVKQVEVDAKATLASTTFKGRLDRIDQGNSGLAIVDYKTGYAPDQSDVDEGEAVQLPHYALAADGNIRRVEYLRLDKNRFGSAAVLEDEALEDMTQQVAARLEEVLQAGHAGEPFPAWGDEATCLYCVASGICRKQAWNV